MNSYSESAPKLIASIRLAPSMASKFEKGSGFIADKRVQKGGVDKAFKFIEKYGKAKGGKDNTMYNYIENIYNCLK